MLSLLTTYLAWGKVSKSSIHILNTISLGAQYRKVFRKPKTNQENVYAHRYKTHNHGTCAFVYTVICMYV